MFGRGEFYPGKFPFGDLVDAAYQFIPVVILHCQTGGLPVSSVLFQKPRIRFIDLIQRFDHAEFFDGTAGRAGFGFTVITDNGRPVKSIGKPCRAQPDDAHVEFTVPAADNVWQMVFLNTFGSFFLDLGSQVFPLGVFLVHFGSQSACVRKFAAHHQLKGQTGFIQPPRSVQTGSDPESDGLCRDLRCPESADFG